MRVAQDLATREDSGGPGAGAAGATWCRSSRRTWCRSSRRTWCSSDPAAPGLPAKSVILAGAIPCGHVSVSPSASTWLRYSAWALNRDQVARCGDQRELPRSAVDLRMDRAPPGNGHCTDTDTHVLDLLRRVLGAKVIATYAHGRAPLPDTGPCSRCGTTTTRYGPAGSPMCAQCRASIFLASEQLAGRLSAVSLQCGHQTARDPLDMLEINAANTHWPCQPQLAPPFSGEQWGHFRVLRPYPQRHRNRRRRDRQGNRQQR